MWTKYHQNFKPILFIIVGFYISRLAMYVIALGNYTQCVQSLGPHLAGTKTALRVPCLLVCLFVCFLLFFCKQDNLPSDTLQ